jgi:hypothetical protein
MACKRSGVRIPIAPLSQVFPGQSLTDRLLRVCAQDSCGQTGGVGCGICAGHSRLELLRPSLACSASERAISRSSPGFRCSCSSGRLSGWASADFALADLRREPCWEHAAASEETLRAVICNSPDADQEAFGRSGRLPDFGGWRTSGTCFPWRTCEVPPRLSLLTAPAEDCWRPRSCRERLPGTPQPVSD